MIRIESKRHKNLPGVKQRIRRKLKFVRNDVRGEVLSYLPARSINQAVGHYDPRALQGSEVLVSTKRGLYFLSGGSVIRLLDGQCFGLSSFRGAWYVFQRMSCWSGRIVRFELSQEGMASPKSVIGRLSPGCHQIDFLGSQLYVMDTYSNRVLVFDAQSWRLVGEHFPAGKLDQGRQSDNYAHMNSVWSDGEDIWLMFHNETAKTGNRSELVRLDHQHRLVERIDTNAGNAHNVAMIRGEAIFCDSNDGTLVWGERPVYRTHEFTRGLSITDDTVLVGQSQYGQRHERERLAGSIAVLSRDFELRQVIPTPGMVQDIRTVNTADYAMSQHAKNERSFEAGADRRVPDRRVPDRRMVQTA